MPIRATRLPLSPHCNPLFASSEEQPRCFPPQSVRFFSLFCRHGFKEQRTAHAPAGSENGLASHPPCPPQGRLRLHTALRPYQYRCTALQVHYLFRTQLGEYHDGSTAMHKNRSPQKQGRGNHAIGNRPESASARQRASLQHPPNTGRIKQAPQVSSMCPSEDF